MKTFLKNIYILAIVLISLIPSTSFAASVFISSPAVVSTGNIIEVTINANTDTELINSVDVVLKYDKNLMDFSGYKSENSMIHLWVTSPYEKNSSIYLSGIIPGGVAGLYDPNKKDLGAIPLVTLLFTTKQSGNANFSFTKTEILKNDGNGTALIHKNIGSSVNIVNAKIIENQTEVVVDTNKPEPFEVTFLEASIFSETPSMVIFNTSDLGSGVKEYQMSLGGGSWISAKNPQPISKGLLSQTLVIRAFDFSGNFQESVVVVPGLLSQQILWILVILLLIFCILAYRMIKYKHGKFF